MTNHDAGADFFRTYRTRRRGRRTRVWSLGVAAAVLVGLVVAGSQLMQRSEQTAQNESNLVRAATPPTSAPTRPHAQGLPQEVFGFYSAGLKPSSCYGACTPGTEEYEDQELTRRRLRELRSMHVNFVANNSSVVDLYTASPAAFFRFMDEVHAQGISVSYSIASGSAKWFDGDHFDPTEAEEQFKATDLDGDGVSDLDGVIDVLYQGHEVIEWADHDERVAIYRVAKRWFPATPISVYYAGFQRPTHPDWMLRPHPSGGVWRDYAYGPGEADIVHIGVRKNADDLGDPRRPSVDSAWNEVAFAAQVRASVRLVTPGIPVIISTSFDGDDQMQDDIASMWPTDELREWYVAATEPRQVRGALLRSYGRFRYDLAYDAFDAQRRAWRALGSDVAEPARVVQEQAA